MFTQNGKTDCDYLIVGAGLFGATFARMLAENGWKCTVIDKRSRVGGNCADHREHNILVHDFGAHIFHTNNKRVWDFVNRFATFKQYQHNVKAMYHGKVYSLPFNMNTFYQLFGAVLPDKAREVITSEIKNAHIDSLKGLEQRAVSLVGTTIYNTLVKEYTEKQWGKSCAELPASIINRLPLRFTYDNNYFNDTYQGLPIEGYTKLVENMLTHENINVVLNTRYEKHVFAPMRKTLYCGPIDEFFDYQLGKLEYRTLKFETESLPVDNFQGCPVMNYTSHDVPFTRILEYKHFLHDESRFTIITREYPKTWQPGDEPYYPVNDDKNTELYKQYVALAYEHESDVIFGGRLGLYKYYDMDKAIDAAMVFADAEIWL